MGGRSPGPPMAQGKAWAEGAQMGLGARPGAGGGPAAASGSNAGPGSTNLEAGNVVKESAGIHRWVLLTRCEAAALSLLQKSQTPCVAPRTGNATTVRVMQCWWQEEPALRPRGSPGIAPTPEHPTELQTEVPAQGHLKGTRLGKGFDGKWIR